MAAAAVMNLISTGSAGLGISKESSVKGALLLQLQVSSWIFIIIPKQEPEIMEATKCFPQGSENP